jgi:holliday junction DNA helicase RuvA
LITKISGRLTGLAHDTATLSVDPFEYQVLIPEFTRRSLQDRMGQDISLHTIHYFDGDPSRGRVTPRLIGFGHEVEREFFELFCSVDGVGVKKALRAMVRPVRELANEIEGQDAKSLSTLPGVGAKTAEKIIAELRRKMAKFALMMAGSDASREADAAADVVGEAFKALLQIGFGEAEARKELDAALKLKKKYDDSGAILQAIFDARSRKA